MKFQNEIDQRPNGGALRDAGARVVEGIENGKVLIGKLLKKFDIQTYLDLIGAPISIINEDGTKNNYRIVGIDPSANQTTIVSITAEGINSEKEQKLTITDLLEKPYTCNYDKKMDNSPYTAE